MRRKKCGHKVQNWHRPLAPHHLGRWFRRHRYDAIPGADDYDWDEVDWGHDRPAEDDAPDLRGLDLKQLLRQIVHRPPPLFRLEWAVDAANRSEDECAFSPGRGQPAEHLEQQLAAFTHGITHFPNSPATRRRKSEAIGDDVYMDVMKSAAGRAGDRENFVQNLCLFAPFSIRSPRTWKGGEASLVDHLFVRYEVPRFLHAEWSGVPDFPRLKWLCWFILLAQGGSLRRAAGLFGWNIPGRFEHYLRMAPAPATPQEACAFAQVLRLGGSPHDGRRILSNPAFVVDTTEAAAGDGPSDFWEATVRWVIAHQGAITDEQCERILSWAMHEQTEANRRGAPPFSWKGRGLRAVLQRSLEYQRQLERPWSLYTWKPYGWHWKPIDLTLDGWSFVELTSGEELLQEGQAMRHCVAGYAARCAAGHCAIVSVRFNGARRITVEINPATGQVVQARGTCNRPATSEEQRVIRHWVDAAVRLNCPGAPTT
jgi:PcfJ-like protein